MGNRAAGRKVIAELRALSKGRYVSPYRFACIYASLAENDKALDWLDKAFEEPEWLLLFLRLEPAFDSLHTHPRFTALLQRMNLLP
jgi:hypothetical protein